MLVNGFKITDEFVHNDFDGREVNERRWKLKFMRHAFTELSNGPDVFPSTHPISFWDDVKGPRGTLYFLTEEDAVAKASKMNGAGIKARELA